jgi:hypothetical protein
VSARRLLPPFCLVLALGGVSSAGATTPGPNGRIAFASYGELYSVNADGSALKRLTWTLEIEQAPTWSPDGMRIAYESYMGGRLRIWAMNADGSAQAQLTFSKIPITDDDPAWSPDGTQIAFASTRSGSWNLWVMNADGSDLRQVSTVFGNDPAWSPDGRRLAYVGRDGIGVVGADGSAQHVVSALGASASGPSWSPDGSQIVFSRTNPSGNPGELFIANADGSGERLLTNDGYMNAGPSWSPDGTQIVFERTNTSQIVWNLDLWAIAVDGTGPRRVTSGVNARGADWGSSQAVPEPSPPEAPAIRIDLPDLFSFYLPTSQAPAYYVCTSYVSYIVSCVGDVPYGAQLDVTQGGTHTFTVRAVDAEGRTATSTVTYEVFDPAPTIEIWSPRDGFAYTLGDTILAWYSCGTISGVHIVTCTGPVAGGSVVDTASVGPKTFTVTASDARGKSASLTSTYTVVYSFTGFDSPVSAGGSIDTAKAGESLPLKFSLRGNQGLGVVTRTTWQPVSCADWTALGDSTAGLSKLSYSASSDRYLDVVVTDSSWKGSCRTVDLELADGTHHAVHVRFTK